MNRNKVLLQDGWKGKESDSTGKVPEGQISQLSDFVATRLGLHFPPGRWIDLERQSKLAAKEFGFAGFEPFLQWLLASPLDQQQVEMLASYLTISETYFWREPQVFEALRDQILPELIRARATRAQRLRIWSAGCATGEEPYSIAIALRQALPDLQDWHITLLATDINPNILRQATLGVYGQWSFRNAPVGFREKYFSQRDKGKFEILPEIRAMVTFRYLNLAEDIFPGALNNTNAMDLIFCRNVLMYFAPMRAQLVGQHFHQCLVDGGWFVTSASELSQYTFAQFAPVHFPGTIVYRRESGKPRPPLLPPMEQAAPAQSLPVQPLFETVTFVDGAALPARPRRPEPMQPAEAVEIAHEETRAPNTASTVWTLANLGKLDAALAACEAAIATDKLNPKLYYLYAAILQEQNRGAEAMAALRRSLYLDPDFLLAHFSMGNLALREGHAAAATKNFNNALALLSGFDPDDIPADAEGLTAGRLRQIIRATLQIGVSTR